MVDLKKFVDINIQPKTIRDVNAIRDTVALFSNEKTLANAFITSKYEPSGIYSYEGQTYDLAAATDTQKYIEMYFNNGGKKLRVDCKASYASETLVPAIAALQNEIIVVCVCGLTYNDVKTIAQTRNADSSIYGINEKIICAMSNSSADTDSVKNFAVKYSSVVGAEMTIAAYLSKIEIRGTDSIRDYMFTIEQIAAENVTTSAYETLIANNYNVDISLANAVRNCGGNNKDGNDVVNEFVRIVLHQTLTDRLLTLLTTKIKNTSGIGKMYATIANELSLYVDAGYLTKDKIWTDETLTVTKNQKTYTVITQGTPIIDGYYVTVLPLDSLTEPERAQHKAPAVYVILATQYGIRAITINGEVV